MFLDELNKKELELKESFLSNLNIKKRKTKKPVIVAMMGLVGSGKTHVAKNIMRHIGGAVIEANEVRLLIRERGMSDENIRSIYMNIVHDVISKGNNVILDSDFCSKEKTDYLKERAKEIKARVFLVRVHCDIEVAIDRNIRSTYTKNDLFGSQKLAWTKNANEIGRVMKIRDMFRRVPHHYEWSEEGGGGWKLKKFKFGISANIDNSEPKTSKKEVKDFINNLF